MEETVALRHIRLTTKTRPHDRFLTAQYRASRPTGERSHDGAFFVVVEIANPWFPNAQIGQTIINTVLREYRRGEHASPLHNFEIALRKTNEILAQITQTGETDWIGNLSSVIALSVGNHLYLAQTGQARSYLFRGGKLVDLAEDLEADETHHPLTTYTNITSGALEVGDRLVFGSRLMGEAISQPDLKAFLAEGDLLESARNLVRRLQTERAKLVGGFLIEATNAQTDEAPATLYLDQSINIPVDALRRAWKHQFAPRLQQGSQRLREGARRSLAWSRDWLIPRLVKIGAQGHAAVRRGGARVLQRAQPTLTNALTKVQTKLPSLGRRRTEDGGRDVKAAVRVHHYSERPRRQPRRSGSLTWAQLLLARLRWPKFFKPIKVTKKRLIALGGAIIVILAIIISARMRRTTQQTDIAASTAETALATARHAQVAAERAFVLGQEEAAKTQYLTAMAAARTASGSAATAAEANVILEQSKTLINQLMNANRVELTVPSATLVDPPEVLASVGEATVALIGTDVYEATADGVVTKTASLPSDIISGSTEVVIDGIVYVPAAAGGLLRYDPDNDTLAVPSLASGSWETGTALASFGSTLYLLDPTKGQIWKYSPSGDGFSAPRPYFTSADPSLLADVIDLGIDGDLYTLKKGGLVTKYTRGTADSLWKLSGVPTPWDSLAAATALFAHPDTDQLYVFESKTDTHPARLIRFGRDGVFAGQLLFPDEWDVELLHWQPTTKTGLVAVGSDVYAINWTE